MTWANGPTNKRDRERFASFPPEFQEEADELARYLYDGSRTVARCWAEALDRCEAWMAHQGIQPVQ